VTHADADNYDLLLRRARLACVDRAFREFCARHATCMRQHTELVVPFGSLQEYMDGVGPWLDGHAGTLQSVRVHFPVRRILLKCLLLQGDKLLSGILTVATLCRGGVTRRRPGLQCCQSPEPVQPPRLASR